MNIGKTITITKAKNRTLEGKTGTIIDETKNTLIIHTRNRRQTIIKDQIAFEETQ